MRFSLSLLLRDHCRLCKCCCVRLIHMFNLRMSSSISAWLEARSKRSFRMTQKQTPAGHGQFHCFSLTHSHHIGTMLVNNVEPLGFMELFRDFLGCLTVLDELFSAVRLEFQPRAPFFLGGTAIYASVTSMCTLKQLPSLAWNWTSVFVPQCLTGPPKTHNKIQLSMRFTHLNCNLSWTSRNN